MTPTFNKTVFLQCNKIKQLTIQEKQHFFTLFKTLSHSLGKVDD